LKDKLDIQNSGSYALNGQSQIPTLSPLGESVGTWLCTLFLQMSHSVSYPMCYHFCLSS